MSFNGQGGSVLSGSIPYLCFTTIVQCNDLTYLKEYSVRQNIIYKLIRHLHEKEGMGYRRISAFMNRSGILSERGKKFSNAIVQSILKFQIVHILPSFLSLASAKNHHMGPIVNLNDSKLWDIHIDDIRDF